MQGEGGDQRGVGPLDVRALENSASAAYAPRQEPKGEIVDRRKEARPRQKKGKGRHEERKEGKEGKDQT